MVQWTEWVRNYQVHLAASILYCIWVKSIDHNDHFLDCINEYELYNDNIINSNMDQFQFKAVTS